MTTKLFAAIRERLEKATPGPWKMLGGGKDFVFINTPNGTLKIKSATMRVIDGKFICNAPTDIARLLAAIDVAVEALKSWNGSDDDFGEAFEKQKEALKKIEQLSNENCK